MGGVFRLAEASGGRGGVDDFRVLFVGVVLPGLSVDFENGGGLVQQIIELYSQGRISFVVLVLLVI